MAWNADMTEMPCIICVGAMLWDIIGHSPARLEPGDDVPGRIRRLPGGVALNIATALAQQGIRPAIMSAVGKDEAGDHLTALTTQTGIDTGWLTRIPHPTDVYMVIESPDGLVAAIADTRGLEAAGASIIEPLRNGQLGDAANPWQGTLVIDGNLTAPVIAGLARDPCLSAARLRIAPASPDKGARLWPLVPMPNAIFHLNRAEARALTGRNHERADLAAEAVIALGAHRVLVTDGANPVAEACRGQPTITQTPPQVAAMRVTGAGDIFLAAHIVAEMAGASRVEAMDAALNAAARHVSGMSEPS